MIFISIKKVIHIQIQIVKNCVFYINFENIKVIRVCFNRLQSTRYKFIRLNTNSASILVLLCKLELKCWCSG